jgi:hypothetical protein
MLENNWLTFEQLIDKSKNKKIIFWGCFDYFQKTMGKYDFKPSFIVDSNVNLHGEKSHFGYDVKPPKSLNALKDKSKYFIIVTSTAFYEIFDILNDYGFTNNYSASPLLIDMKTIQDINNVNDIILFSSSDTVKDHPSIGGGIYKLNLFDGIHNKIISGMTRGFDYYNENLIVNDANVGIRIFDNKYDELDCIKVPKNSYLHGLSIDNENSLLYVVQTRQDRISVFDLNTLKEVDKIEISKKHRRSGHEQYHHHINDIYYFNNSLFISMFTLTGNMQTNWHNGAIIEYDVIDNVILGEIATNLYMPHSIKVLNKTITFLDSMKGHLINDPHTIMAQFPGFVRGLDYNKNYYFIGQSIHRYFKRAIDLSNIISMDAGIYIFEPKTKATRFVKTDGIYDINTLSILQK